MFWEISGQYVQLFKYKRLDCTLPGSGLPFFKLVIPGRVLFLRAVSRSIFLQFVVLDHFFCKLTWIAQFLKLVVNGKFDFGANNGTCSHSVKTLCTNEIPAEVSAPSPVKCKTQEGFTSWNLETLVFIQNICIPPNMSRKKLWHCQWKSMLGSKESFSKVLCMFLVMAAVGIITV